LRRWGVSAIVRAKIRAHGARSPLKELRMGSLSIWHWLLVILVVVLLFGRGKISDLMGDMAKGIKSFKKGLQEDGDAEVKAIDQQQADAEAKQAEKVKG
jgi:sec-independent protein translocase protein TatA